MEKDRGNQFFPYFVVLSIVAIVAMVVIFVQGKSGLEGAPIYEEQIAEDQYPCLDDDPGNDFYFAGTTTYGKIKYLDYCSGNTLFQYACETSNAVKMSHGYKNCPKGCLEGACIR